MKYNLLGNTGVLISEIGLGAMTFGGGEQWGVFGSLGEKEASVLVGQALEAGVNFFDTSNIYAGGRSEEILGKALGKKRQDVIIATKVRGRTGSGPNDIGLSRLHIMRQVEESLKRLGTDYIDLYQIHNPDQLTDWEDTLRALDDLVRSGKVRYIGASNMTGWETMKTRGISRQLGLHEFKSSQLYYSLAGREIEREIIPVLKDQNMGLLVWSPLAGGFLSGKYSRSRQGGRGRSAYQNDVSAGRPGQILSHHRRAGGNCERAGIHRCPDRFGLGAPSACGDQRHRRREAAGSASRQSCGQRHRVDAGRIGPPRRSQQAACRIFDLAVYGRG
nr:aldo/keto reductase [Paenibacillus cookii]